jgi:ATP-dependent Clp protease ATP-binding subunit ClpB
VENSSYWSNNLDEYQKYFEKDKALERRFQKIIIEEPDTESAISILRGIKEKYETHHKVQIKDEAIISSCGIIRTLYHKSFSTR